MSSLRVAFVQTCPSGNPYFFLLPSISCLLSSLLGLEDKSTQQAVTSFSNKISQLSSKFGKVNSILKDSKNRSTWIESFTKKSLIQISNDDLTDFQKGTQRRDFVHILEIVQQDCDETSEIKTVKSEEIDFGQLDPTSTQISQQSDMDLSQLDDF